MPLFDALIWRLAGRLARRLAELRAVQIPSLNDTDWDHAGRLIRCHRDLTRSHRTVASEYVCRDLRRTIGRLEINLDRIRQALPLETSASLSPSQRSIYDELLAIRQEFTEFRFDLRNETLSVLSSEIELEEVYFGRYRILIDYSDLTRDILRIVAESSGIGSRSPSHPHVNGDHLCEGKAELPLRAALESGRFADFLQIVDQTLQTYNRESAYVDLADPSEGGTCYSCGDHTSDHDRSYCDFCDDEFCESCSRSCDNCEVSVCHDCAARCEACEDVVCPRCLTNGCCEECHEHQNASEEQPGSETTASRAAVHATGLGEATVPAGSG